MKMNTKGNYGISIKGTYEEVQLEKSTERLKTTTIKMIGQRVDLRSGISLAMNQDKSFAQLILDAVDYYKKVKSKE